MEELQPTTKWQIPPSYATQIALAYPQTWMESLNPRIQPNTRSNISMISSLQQQPSTTGNSQSIPMKQYLPTPSRSGKLPVISSQQTPTPPKDGISLHSTPSICTNVQQESKISFSQPPFSTPTKVSSSGKDKSNRRKKCSTPGMHSTTTSPQKNVSPSLNVCGTISTTTFTSVNKPLHGNVSSTIAASKSGAQVIESATTANREQQQSDISPDSQY